MGKVKDLDDEEKEEVSLEIEKMMDFMQSKKVYKCTYPRCTTYFDRPYRLAQHILAHNNIRPYLCTQPNCGKAYTSKSHLDRHLRTVHLPQEKDTVFSCARCFKTFANRQNLKRHMNTVHQQEFSCEICEKAFKKKNQLSTHMYQHTGIKAFSCDQCSESFVSLYLKKRHMRYHKTYTCFECRQEFNHWSKYQKHLKTDHQQYEFICNECGRAFNKRCHIVRHVKIHTGLIRTFMCPYENCERSYSRNNNLKQHILVKHMDVLHECMICHSRLSTKAKLNYHVQLHYTSKPAKPPPKLIKERKERKDKGSFKTSTALKLSGLSKAPDDNNSSLRAVKDVHDDINSTDDLVTLSDLCEVTQTLNSGKEVTEPENTELANPVNLTVKSECIEVEVDIPYI